MKYWVISPNVTNKPDEEPLWKAAIMKHQVAIMGWEEHTKFGRMFMEDIQQGDIILVAQGANWKKRLFLAGMVGSDAFQRHLPNTPRSALQRQLTSCIGKEELYAMNLDFTGSANGSSSQIPALYRFKPWENEKDKAIAEQLEKAINKKSDVKPMKNIIDLLKYKKQIILQGPPGTGKTKLAKEIAQELTRPQAITKDDVKRIIKVGQEIRSIYDGIPYTITTVTDNSISLRLENGNTQARNYDQIIVAYVNRIQNKPLVGGDAYQAAIAKYILDNWQDNALCKLIQFHPSYSYEDFVRGIVAKPNDEGDGVLYEAENKLLPKFAKEAADNYSLSQTLSEEVSKTIQTKSDFERFVEYVQDFIADSPDQKFPLTNDVYLFSSDTARFKYKGDNWMAHSKGLNMKYSELQKIIDAGVTERVQIKNIGVEELTKQHATYFFNTVKKFKEFIQSNPTINGAVTVKEKISLKNYILIIDEINRANLSSVLGELIYALEYRGENVESMYEIDGSNVLVLPPNLYIIGTMNTADRSVGHIDYAIRRRFAFVDVLPEVLKNDFETDLFHEVSKLFVKDISATPLEASEHLSSEFRPQDVWLGHSYFIKLKDVDSRTRLKYEIIPILEEYIKDGVLKESQSLRVAIKSFEQKIA